MINKKHFAWLDMVRTIAMALVVLSHACDYMVAEYTGYHPVWHSFISCLITVAVPTFFVISGYLVAIRGGEGRRQFTRLIPPFLMWSFFFLLINLMVFNIPITHPSLIFETLTGTRHLYFLFALMQLHLLLALIYSSITKNNIYSLLLIYSLVTMVIYAVSDISSWTNLMQTEIFVEKFEGFVVKFGMTWGLFYFLGIFFAFRPTTLESLSDSYRLLTIITVGCFAVYILEFVFNGNGEGTMARKYTLLAGLLYQIFGTLAIVSFFFSRREAAGKIYTWLSNEGRYTFGIYLVHPVIIILFVVLIKPMQVKQGYVLPISLLLSPFSWIVSSCLTRIAGPFITGEMFIKKQTGASRLIARQ